VGEITRAKPDAPWSPGLVQALALVTTAVILLWAASTLAAGTTATATAARLRDAVRDIREGDTRRGLRGVEAVLDEEPRSLTALSVYACEVWRAGYQDQAVRVLQAAYARGLPLRRSLYRPCFADRLAEHGLAAVRSGPAPALYARPSSRRSRRYEVELFRAVREGDHARAYLALACLNDAEGLRLVAALDFGLQQVAHGEGRATPALRRCLRGPIRRGYAFRRDPNGVEHFFPRDADRREFHAGTSPIPARLPRVLP
jgi:hypothetical protein